MQIWVDADACPSEIKQLLFRAAERTKTKVTLVRRDRDLTELHNVLSCSAWDLRSPGKAPGLLEPQGTVPFQ